MTTKFPAALDSFPTINGTDLLTSPQHSAQHNNVADAISALQTKVGVNGSTVTTSLTYQVSQKADINHTHTGVYAASSHGHVRADITGLDAALNDMYTKAEVTALLASGGKPEVHDIPIGSSTTVPANGIGTYGPFTIAGLTEDDGICVNVKGQHTPMMASGYCLANDKLKVQLFNPTSAPVNPNLWSVIVTVFKP